MGFFLPRKEGFFLLRKEGIPQGNAVSVQTLVQILGRYTYPNRNMNMLSKAALWNSR